MLAATGVASAQQAPEPPAAASPPATPAPAAAPQTGAAPASNPPAAAPPQPAGRLSPVVVEKPVQHHLKPKNPAPRPKSASLVHRRTTVARRAPTPQARPQPPERQARPQTPERKELATSLGAYNPALDLPNLQLPPGTALTTAGPVDGYHALSAFSATKTATPIEQIPQSIQVIPQSVIAGQNNVTVTEALQNASNVQGTNSLAIATTGLTGSTTIRGFPAQYWLDGLAVNYSEGDLQTLSNVERIEVLKGPNAILYGGGVGSPVGGAYNVVSKLPTDKASVETGVTGGTNAYVQPYFDINQPLNADKTVLFRFTGAYTSTDSFINELHQNRYSLNPTLTITDKSDTTLTIQGNFSRFEEKAYEGLPAVGTVAGNFRINPYMFIGNVPMSYTEVNGVTATLDHRFNSIWSFNMKARFWIRATTRGRNRPSARRRTSRLLPPGACRMSTWPRISGR